MQVLLRVEEEEEEEEEKAGLAGMRKRMWSPLWPAPSTSCMWSWEGIAPRIGSTTPLSPCNFGRWTPRFQLNSSRRPWPVKGE